MNRNACVVLSLIALGCENLPDLQPETCNNGVIDTLEDCDTFADPSLSPGGELVCTACTYRCTPITSDSDDRTVCPVNAYCGRDGECRSPSGKFELETTLAFPGESLVVEDFDGDNILDVLGGTPTQLELRYGSTDGSFSEALAVSVDVSVGPREVVDLQRSRSAPSTRPRRNDIILPMTAGLAVLEGDSARELIPRAFPGTGLLEVDDGGDFELRSVPFRIRDEGEVLTFVTNVGNTLLAFILADSASDAPFIIDEQASLGNVAGRISSTFLQGDYTETVAMAIEGGDEVYLVSLIAPVCESEMSCEPISLENRSSISLNSLGPFARVAEGTLFADLDGDRIDDLLVGVQDLMRGVPGLAWARGSTLTPSGFEPLAWVELQCDAGPLRIICPGLPLAVGPMASVDDQILDFVGLVYSSGVFVLDPRNMTREPVELVYGNRGQPWSQAEWVDLDKDGRLDVVAISAISPMLDMLINTSQSVFNRFAIPTETPASRFRIGDFDGDTYPDIAIAQPFGVSEQLPGSQQDAPEIFSVAVIYTNGPSDTEGPILMGRFEGFESMEAATLRTEIPGVDDAIDDLIILSYSEDDYTLALMEGTGQRRLHALLSLTESFPPAFPALVRSGFFNANDQVDLVAFGECVFDEECEDPLEECDFDDECDDLYLIPDANNDALTVSGVVPLQSNLTSCLGLGPIRIGCLNAVVGTLDESTGLQQIVAVNRGPECPPFTFFGPPIVAMITVDAAAGSATCQPLEMAPIEGANLDGDVQLALADVDNNQQMDIVALFSGTTLSLPSPNNPMFRMAASGLAVWRNPLDVSSRVDVLESLPDHGQLFAIEVVDLERGLEEEIAVLSETGVRIIGLTDLGWTGWRPVIEDPIPNSPVSRSLRYADIDGDGLRDFLIGTENRLFIYKATRRYRGEELEDASQP